MTGSFRWRRSTSSTTCHLARVKTYCSTLWITVQLPHLKAKENPRAPAALPVKSRAMSAVPYNDWGKRTPSHVLTMTTNRMLTGLLHSNQGISEARWGIHISLTDWSIMMKRKDVIRCLNSKGGGGGNLVCPLFTVTMLVSNSILYSWPYFCWINSNLKHLLLCSS